MLKSSNLVLDHNLKKKLIDLSKEHEKQIEKKEKTLLKAISILSKKLRELEEDELKLRLLFNFDQDDSADNISEIEHQKTDIVDIPPSLNKKLILDANPYRNNEETEEQEEEEEEEEDDDDIPVDTHPPAMKSLMEAGGAEENIQRFSSLKRHSAVSDIINKLEQQEAEIKNDLIADDDDDNSLIVNISSESNSELSPFSSDDDSSLADDAEVDISRNKVLADEVNQFFKIVHDSSDSSNDEDEEINEDDLNIKHISKLLDDFN